jgi:two-component system, sensor histidine kinase and response regulator
MVSQERSRSFQETIYITPDLNIPYLVEAPGIPAGLIRQTFNDLRRSQEQLREDLTVLQIQNKELEAYARMVAHDLKDPLTVMVVTSDLIADVPDLTRQELRDCLRQIRSTAYEMNRIINNLLLFAEVSKAEAPAERVNMVQVVANVRERLSGLIAEHQAQISLPEVWPEAFGYAPWIEEVWANYISNAIKHGGQPPRVDLGASTQPDGMLRFWTRDNGPGLPPDTQASLFKPFDQISHVCNPGHGLGLSIVLHIVEKLGGQVGVESELGQGSLFYFTLPAQPPQNKARSHGDQSTDKKHPARSAH